MSGRGGIVKRATGMPGASPRVLAASAAAVLALALGFGSRDPLVRAQTQAAPLVLPTAPAFSPDGDRLAGLRPILDAPEAALVQAAFDLRGGAQAGIIERLRRLSSDHAGEPVSGLAQVLIAKSSLALGRFDDAAAAARHPDIDATSLGDRALLILGRAKARAGDFGGAASAYLRAIDATVTDDVACSARLGAAGALQQIKQNARRIPLLTEAAAVCRQDHSDVLLDLAQALLGQGSGDEALTRLEEIERVYPTSQEAQTAASLIATLLGPAGSHAQRSPRQDFERRLARAKALLDGGQRTAAIAELRKLRVHKAVEASIDDVQVALARGLSRTAPREAQALLATVPDGSPARPEARLVLARMAPESERPGRLRELADEFPATQVAEEALYSLATFYQKDALYADAAPYYRRIVDEFASSAYAEGAAMRAAFEALRAGRARDAAPPLETMARRAKSPAGFLYWAGMARLRNGETDRASTLLHETMERFRNTWYGNLAADEVTRLEAPSATRVTAVSTPAVRAELPPLVRARLRDLLLVGLSSEALDELKTLGSTSAALEARAYIEADRGELRNAIISMKRARPEFIFSQVKDLPASVWTTIYPLKHAEALRAASWREGLDPALVAALICQESTFDARAKSAVGARGLMQIMPYTGRPLARELGRKFTTGMLNEPETSLTLGTRYLRQMLDRFNARPEAALAAYNAGPHRVARWLAPNPEIRSDEFAESIPFTETRNYVMIILGAREQYRRLYGLEPSTRPGD